MLLFKRKFLDAIRSGEKTQTLRNWKTARVRAGQKDTIPGVGPIWIDSVEKVSLDDLTDADAIPDGFSSLDALKKELHDIYGDGALNFYRIRFHLLKENEEEKPAPTRKSRPVPKKIVVPRSSETPAVVNFALEMKREFSKRLEQYKHRLECEDHRKLHSSEAAPRQMTEADIVEKMVQRCRVNRNVCDWNHEPGKSQDFFALFLQAPRDERGIPTLDGYRLRSLMRDLCTGEQWEEINWIATEICSAWTEWQYAVEHWVGQQTSTRKE